MKIVITDGYTLNAGDLDWESIQKFGELTIYDRTPLDQVISRCQDADIVLTNKVSFDEHTIEKLPRLQLICVTATGYNIIDIDAAKNKGVAVCNVPGYGTASVAQHAIALLLEITNHIGKNARSTAEGKWQRSEDWCYTEAPITELSGKTLGIVGFGNIGQQTARIAAALGMSILYHNRSVKNTALGRPVDLATLFAESDVVSLHCPLTSDNLEFVNAALLATMKPSAVLINTARGQLINEGDLANALNTGKIAGAGLDVLSKEPPFADNLLLSAKNCIITPHNAWMSREARQRILDTTVENIKAFVNGQAIHVVNA